MLGHRLWHWPNSNPALGLHLMFAGTGKNNSRNLGKLQALHRVDDFFWEQVPYFSSGHKHDLWCLLWSYAPLVFPSLS